MKSLPALLISLLLVLCISCKNERKQEFVAEIPYYTKLISNNEKTFKLWKKAIDEGDFKAYNLISNAYLLADMEYELYYYSMIMANKYDCPEAYHHLFLIMNDKVAINGLVLYSDDEVTKSMSLYYLLKSKELGNTQAQYEIDEIFGKGKQVPASLYYLKKLVK